MGPKKEEEKRKEEECRREKRRKEEEELKRWKVEDPEFFELNKGLF